MLQFITTTAHNEEHDPQEMVYHAPSNLQHLQQQPQSSDSMSESENGQNNTIRPISKVAESRHSAWLEAQQRAHFLILPDTWFAKMWDIIVSIVSFASGVPAYRGSVTGMSISVVTVMSNRLSCAVWKIPYDIAFEIPEVDVVFVLNIVVDVVFILDIIFNFRRCYRTKWGIETDPKKIGSRYLKGWFIIDLIPAIPVDLLATIYFAEETDPVAVIRGTDALKLLRLPRLFRLLRIFRLARIFSMRSSFGAPVTRIFMLIFLSLLFIHWDACFEYLVLVVNNFPPGSWTEDAGVSPQDNQSSWEYVLSCNAAGWLMSLCHSLFTCLRVESDDRPV